MLEQIFLTGLLPVEKPTLELRKSVRRKEKQSRLVRNGNPHSHPTCTSQEGEGRHRSPE